jgi:hypothetical protein
VAKLQVCDDVSCRHASFFVELEAERASAEIGFEPANVQFGFVKTRARDMMITMATQVWV